jgi:hypothetical protein
VSGHARLKTGIVFVSFWVYYINYYHKVWICLSSRMLSINVKTKTRENYRVSSGGSDHKKENQLVRRTEWLNSYPHGLVVKAGSSQIICCCFFLSVIEFELGSAVSNYVKALHCPIHSKSSGWIAPSLLHRTEQLWLLGVNTIRPPFDFVVLSSAIILWRVHVRGAFKRPAECIIVLCFLGKIIQLYS